MQSFFIIIIVETNYLIPLYLSQVALAVWKRDPKTWSCLEVHEMKYTSVSAFGAGFACTPFHWLEGNKSNFHMIQTKSILDDVTNKVFLLFGPLET